MADALGLPQHVREAFGDLRTCRLHDLAYAGQRQHFGIVMDAQLRRRIVLRRAHMHLVDTLTALQVVDQALNDGVLRVSDLWQYEGNVEAQFVGHADVINPEKMSDIVDASSRPENMEGSSIQAMGLPFACRRVTTPSHGLASTAAGEQQVDADWPDASMNEARIAQSCDLSPSQRARSARSWRFNSRSEVRR